MDKEARDLAYENLQGEDLPAALYVACEIASDMLKRMFPKPELVKAFTPEQIEHLLQVWVGMLINTERAEQAAQPTTEGTSF